MFGLKSQNSLEDYLDKPLYYRKLGWKEVDEDNDNVEALFFVQDARMGYNIFRRGSNVEHVEWLRDRNEAFDRCYTLAQAEIDERKPRGN